MASSVSGRSARFPTGSYCDNSHEDTSSKLSFSGEYNSSCSLVAFDACKSQKCANEGHALAP
jgi:hypothetical protein